MLRAPLAAVRVLRAVAFVHQAALADLDLGDPVLCDRRLREVHQLPQRTAVDHDLRWVHTTGGGRVHRPVRHDE